MRACWAKAEPISAAILGVFFWKLSCRPALALAILFYANQHTLVQSRTGFGSLAALLTVFSFSYLKFRTRSRTSPPEAGLPLPTPA